MKEGPKHWPKKEEAIGVAKSLSEVVQILEKLDLKDVSEAQREYVVRGRIDAADLRRIQRLDFEVMLSRNDDTYVLSTGTEEMATPHLDGYDIHDPTKPSSLQRGKSSRASFHNHPDDVMVDLANTPDEEIGLVPSDGDLYVLQNSQRKEGIIATRKGLMVYRWPDDDLMKRWRAVEYTNEINTRYGKWIPGTQAWEGFLRKEGVIVQEVPWANTGACQALVDTFFDQKPVDGTTI